MGGLLVGHFPGVDLLELVVISCLPFGGHFVKNCLSSLTPYVIESMPGFGQTEFGMLLALQSLPNLLLPLLGAALMSVKWPGIPALLVLFPALVFLGQMVFILGMHLQSLAVAGAGALLVGSGGGCCVMAQRSLAAGLYQGRSLTFAIGVTVSTAAVSKTIARSATAVIAHATGGNVTLTLLFTLLPCGLGVAAGSYYGCGWLTQERIEAINAPASLVLPTAGPGMGLGLRHTCGMMAPEPPGAQATAEAEAGEMPASEATPLLGSPPLAFHERPAPAGGALYDSTANQAPMHVVTPADLGLGDPVVAARRAERRYACGVAVVVALVCLHGLVVNAFHLFAQFAVPILRRRNNYTVEAAGVASALSTSVPVLGAPLTGLFLDHFRGRKTLVAMAVTCGIMTAAYAALYAMPSISPIPLLIIFSAVEAILPTAIMALLPMGVALSQSAFVTPEGGRLQRPFTEPQRPCDRPRVNLHGAYAGVEVLDATLAAAGSLCMGYTLDLDGEYGRGASELLTLAFVATCVAVVLMCTAPKAELRREDDADVPHGCEACAAAHRGAPLHTQLQV